MRPYHLYTGKQFVHYDKRWGLEESRDLYAQYTSRLHPVDAMYERIFRIFKSKAYYGVMESRQEDASRKAIITARAYASPADTRISQLEDSLRRVFSQTRDSVLSSLSQLADSYAPWTSASGAHGPSRAEEVRQAARARVTDLQETLSTKLDDLGSTLSSRLVDLRASFSSTTDDLRSTATTKLDEIGEVVTMRVGDIRSAVATRIGDMRGTAVLRIDAASPANPSFVADLADSVSARLGELGESVTTTINDFKRQLTEFPSSAAAATHT